MPKGAAAAALALLFVSGAGPLGRQSLAGEAEVLAGGTVWRCHFTWRPELFGTRTEAKPGRGRGYERSDAPPPGWREPDFDDGDWWRARLPVYGGYGFRQPRTLALLCVRGTFGVDDPRRAGELTLSAVFRGGLVLCVNGREVARSHMPGGELTPESLAEDYPLDAYLAPNGRRIGPRGERPGTKDIADRLALRMRRAKEVRIPRELLRKGRNVLALELHRPASAAGLPEYAGGRAYWNKVGLESVTLAARSGRGIVPNVGPPDGLQVWNANTLQEVSGEVCYGDPSTPLRPVRLVAPRNGAASGQVVVSSRAGLRGLGRGLASAGTLRRKGGGGAIPAEAVRVRYAARPTAPDVQAGRLREVAYHDILLDEPPREARVLPVWVTVEAPADAAAGEYEGTLTLRLPGTQSGTGGAGRKLPGGKRFAVPIELTVCDWKLPAPREFATHVSVLQSPETVALVYKTPLWSSAHWQLVEKSLALAGEIGNKVVYVTVIRRTHFGNEHGMIRFHARQGRPSHKQSLTSGRKGAGGRYLPDFSVFDRYTELYAKRVGVPSALVLYVWEPNMYSRRRGRAKELPLTLVDAAGRPQEWTRPMYGEPGTEELFRPLMDGVRERVARRGWSEERIMLGVGADSRPHEDTVRFFKRIAPYARWALFTHGRGDPRPKDGTLTVGEMEVGYCEKPGVRRSGFPLRDGTLGGWDRPFLMASSERGLLLAYSPLGSYRSMAWATVTGDSRGFGRVGLDFWPTKGTASSGRGGSLLCRYRTNNTLDINLMRDNPRCIVSPGPQGAVGTVRFEMLREGIQECEARIFVERALREAQGDERLRARLGEALVKRCREALNDLYRAHLLGRDSWPWLAGSGWQERTKRLYDLAAEIARAAPSRDAAPRRAGAGDG